MERTEMIVCGLCASMYEEGKEFRAHVLIAHPEWFWEEFEGQG